MDSSLQVHGIFQVRVLEWVAISFSRGSSPPRDRTRVSRIVGRCFTHWATREALKAGVGIYKKRKEVCFEYLEGKMDCRYLDKENKSNLK